MVRLDAGLALEDVRPDRALREELHAVELAGFVGKHVDELLADDVALLLRRAHARELVEEAVDRVDIDEVRVHLIAEHLDDLLGLALAQETVVDVHADELLAHRLDEQRRDHGGIHAAGQRQQHLAIADLRAQRLDLLGNKLLRQLRRRDALHRLRTGNGIKHRYQPLFLR